MGGIKSSGEGYQVRSRAYWYIYMPIGIYVYQKIKFLLSKSESIYNCMYIYLKANIMAYTD